MSARNDFKDVIGSDHSMVIQSRGLIASLSEVVRKDDACLRCSPVSERLSDGEQTKHGPKICSRQSDIPTTAFSVAMTVLEW